MKSRSAWYNMDKSAKEVFALKEKLLLNAPNPPEAGLICGILEEAGIPYYTVTPGAGAVYAASMNMGVCVYVAEEDYERAVELTDGCLEGDPTFLDFPDVDEEGDGDADDGETL